jgi:hypothetical protein
MTAGQIVAGDARENLRLVYAGYDTGLALLFPEKDAVAAVTIENTIRLSLDSDLSVYSCQGPAQESRRFRVSRIAPRRLDNNENGVFETAEVDGAVQVALSGSPVYAEGRFAGILHKGQSGVCASSKRSPALSRRCQGRPLRRPARPRISLPAADAPRTSQVSGHPGQPFRSAHHACRTRKPASGQATILRPSLVQLYPPMAA